MAAAANSVQNIATTQYPYRQLDVTLNEIRLLEAQTLLDVQLSMLR